MASLLLFLDLHLRSLKQKLGNFGALESSVKGLQVPVDFINLYNELALGVRNRCDAPQDVLLALALHHMVADAFLLAHPIGEPAEMITDANLILGIVSILPSAALLVLLLRAAVVDYPPLGFCIDLALE